MNVTTTADTTQNGCAPSDCTLREAIGAANAEAVIVQFTATQTDRAGNASESAPIVLTVVDALFQDSFE